MLSGMLRHGRDLIDRQPDMTLRTDASLSGWGCQLNLNLSVRFLIFLLARNLRCLRTMFR
jgi:hypothetical protein